MIRGFYSGVSSMVSQQTYLNTIANNIANVNTTAFKPQTVAFSALLYQSVDGGDGSEIQNGNGVKVEKTGIDYTQGSLQQTGLEMDCAITQDDGFFAIENKDDGTISYTRDGAFEVYNDGSTAYVVNQAGNFVLSADGERIEVKTKTTTIDTAGNATTTGGFDSSGIGVFRFPNVYGLKLAGGNQYLATDMSGEAESVTNPSMATGYLEASGVDLSRELVRMIEASKGFSLGSKVVQTADDMEKVVNQLRS